MVKQLQSLSRLGGAFVQWARADGTRLFSGSGSSRDGDTECYSEMKNKKEVRWRVYRVLRRLERFTEDSGHGLAATAPKETILGEYENPEECSQRWLVVTTDSSVYALSWDGSVLFCLPYECIRSLSVEGEKRAASIIVVGLASGSFLRLEVCGGDERFRDIWQFHRFLRRVSPEPSLKPSEPVTTRLAE